MDPSSNFNPHSNPSQLKITDLRVARLVGQPMDCNVLRLSTNQGITGYGEARDFGSKTYTLMLKSRLLGENPCDIDRLFRKIKQFGHHGRQAGGVCGIELALIDLAGKAYGVPAYQLAGGKFRDKILCYADTTSSPDPTQMAAHLQRRIDEGFRFLKMDVGIDLLRDTPGALVAPPGMLDNTDLMHPFTGIQITDIGIDALCAYVAAIRDAIGYDIPLAADHFGHLGLESCIRLGRALDQFTLAWYEDMIPWQFTDQYVRLSRAVNTPLCTGEDIYLAQGFADLFQHRAISIAHPDPMTSGGILETKKIGDLAQEHGIAMALHMAGTPIAVMAAVHCAAATENCLALEFHSADLPWWSDLVEGTPRPLVQDGHIHVPDTPGLGITALNEDLMRQHLNPNDPDFFNPTDTWNSESSHDRLWS